MSEQKVRRSVEQRIVIKFLVGENVLSAEIHHRLQQQYGEPFYYQLMHIMLKNTELLKHSKITLQHVSVYIETIFRELKSVLG